MIETAIKEDLILDKKLIIPKNKLDAIRIMNERHPVVGGQPTHEKDQPNDNNPILDLACTLANIHASGVGEHADLRSIQNESPKYFYGKGFMSGISSLKGNGILVVFGQWRDASGRYAIKQFYYTDKEISYRNAISDTAWSGWIDVLTGNSFLDYNKLLNVPLTSTLSDNKTKIASIFSVNDVNRKAVNAQKTANTANANAIDAMNEAKKKVDPKDVKSESLKNGGIYTPGSNLVPKLEAGMHGLAMASSFIANNDGLDFADFPYVFLHYYVQANYNNSKTRLVCFFNGYGNGEWYISSTNNEGVWKQPARFYSTENTKKIKGFLSASGNLIPLTEDQLASSLSDSKINPASIFIVNEVNRAAVIAQQSANNANEKANKAQQDALKGINDAAAADKKAIKAQVTADSKRDKTDNTFRNGGYNLLLKPIETDSVGFYLDHQVFTRGLYSSRANFAQEYYQEIQNKSGVLALLSDVIGLSQKWQDVTMERLPSTSYINSAGKPIQVSVILNFTDGGLELIVDDLIVSSSGQIAGAGNDINFVQAIIPPNSSYKIVLLRGHAISKWMELR